MSFAVNFELSAGTQKLFNQIQRKFSPEGFYPVVVDQLKKDSSYFFYYEIDPDGDNWKPSQRALEEGNKTLHKSGNMELNMQDDETYVLEKTSLGASINVISKYDYAKKHQFGQGKKLAKRTFSGFRKESPELIFQKYGASFSNVQL